MLALHVCHSDGKQLYKSRFILRLCQICSLPDKVICFEKKREKAYFAKFAEQNWELSNEALVVVSSITPVFMESSCARVLGGDLRLISEN